MIRLGAHSWQERADCIPTQNFGHDKGSRAGLNQTLIFDSPFTWGRSENIVNKVKPPLILHLIPTKIVALRTMLWFPHGQQHRKPWRYHRFTHLHYKIWILLRQKLTQNSTIPSYPRYHRSSTIQSSLGAFIECEVPSPVIQQRYIKGHIEPSLTG